MELTVALNYYCLHAIKFLNKKSGILKFFEIYFN